MKIRHCLSIKFIEIVVLSGRLYFFSKQMSGGYRISRSLVGGKML